MGKAAVYVTLAFATLAVTPAARAETEAPVTPSQVGTVSSSATGTPCGTVTRASHTVSGGCVIHAEGQNWNITSHTIFGEIVGGRCDNEFTGHIDSSANGWIALADVAITEAAVNNLNCTHEEGGVQKCSEADAAAVGHPGDWQISGFEDQSDGSLWLNVEICLENTSLGDVDGDLWLRMEKQGGNAITGFSTTDHRLREESVVGEAEFNGAWAVEGNSITVTH